MDRPDRPFRGELQDKLPERVHATALRALLAAHVHDDEPRPRVEGQGDYILGIFLIPIAVPDEDRVYYQEIDFVATVDVFITVSKTPPGEQAFDPKPAKEACRVHEDVGMYAYHLVDLIAERFLDLVDDLDDEIDELEDLVGPAPVQKVGQRLRDLRQDVRGIRRTLTPTRDAIRRIVDDRVELDEGELFPATSRSHSETPTTSCCGRRKHSSRHATRWAACATSCRARSRTTRTKS